MNDNYFISEFYLKYRHNRNIKNNYMLFPIHRNCHPKLKLTDVLWKITTPKLRSPTAKFNPNQTAPKFMQAARKDRQTTPIAIRHKLFEKWKTFGITHNIRQLSLSKERPTTSSPATNFIYHSTVDSPINLSCTTIKLEHRASLKPSRDNKYHLKPPQNRHEVRKIIINLRPHTVNNTFDYQHHSLSML